MKAYGLFDEVLSVHSESESMGRHIHCFMKQLELPEDSERGPTARLAIFETPQSNLMMCCPELSLAEVKRPGLEAWIRFRRIFMQVLLHEQRPHYALHASCVADEHGRAAILAGSQNAGKTSLLTAMLKRGYRLVTDDYALLPLDKMAIKAIPTGVTACASFFDHFPEFNPYKSDDCKFFCQKEWQWTLNPADIYKTAPAFATMEPTHVYFIAPCFGEASSLEPCPRDDALWWLQLHQVDDPRSALRHHDLQYQRQCLAFVQRLAAHTRCYWIMNGNLDQAADLIAASFKT